MTESPSVKPIQDFYLTLPSNDGSRVAFPRNKNHHWTNELPHPLELEGDWEVALSQITLPSESVLLEYFSTLQDDALLLRTRNQVKSPKFTTSVHADVTYKDIKGMYLATMFDVLKALFQTARQKEVWQLDKDYTTENLYRVTYDDVNGDVTLSTGHLGTDPMTYYDIANRTLIFLRKDMCVTFGWVKDVPFSGNQTRMTNSPYMTSSLRNDTQGWDDALNQRRSPSYRWPFGLQHQGFQGIFYVRFHLEELQYTFINTKLLTYKKGDISRNMSVYSSLCAPTTVGDPNTDLLRTVTYEPSLDEPHTFEPRHLIYKPIRTSRILTIETAVTETTSPKDYVEFNEGTTILTLHFRKMT